MSVSYANYDQKEAFISSDFGETLARKWFGDEVVDSLPLIKRGKRKGLRKGKIVWMKTVKGGWVKTGAYDFDAQRACGFIAPKGKIFYRCLYADEWGQFDSPVREKVIDRKLYQFFGGGN